MWKRGWNVILPLLAGTAFNLIAFVYFFNGSFDMQMALSYAKVGVLWYILASLETHD